MKKKIVFRGIGTRILRLRVVKYGKFVKFGIK
jgi:hypothetical protein